MVSKEEYIKDPCGMLSIPYWKSKSIAIPENMKVIHDSEFDPAYLSEYDDVEYFRLYHPLKNIDSTNLEGIRIETAKPSDISAIVEVINNSYVDLSVSKEQMTGYKKTKAYHEDLWILAIENESGRVAGCGIADYDKEMKEGILEWIQVLPQYRGRKIGQAIVNGLLCRMKGTARFATVSGQRSNRDKPELLYRKCGFTGNDIWHILYRK